MLAVLTWFFIDPTAGVTAGQIGRTQPLTALEGAPQDENGS